MRNDPQRRRPTMSCPTSPERPMLHVLVLAILLLGVCQAAQAQAPKAPSSPVPSLDDFLRSLAPSGEIGTPSPAQEGLGTPKPTNRVVCGRVPHNCNPGEVCVPCGNDAFCKPQGIVCCNDFFCNSGQICVPCGSRGFCAAPGTSCCNGSLCFSPHSCVVTSFGASCQ
jgi:hypothetical protein